MRDITMKYMLQRIPSKIFELVVEPSVVEYLHENKYIEDQCSQFGLFVQSLRDHDNQ